MEFVPCSSLLPCRYPSPSLKGYFGRRLFALLGLQRVSVCKIFISKWLRLKYLLSVVYELDKKQKPGAFSELLLPLNPF
jgi:hypothetical protein